jgi:hypothetical protein
MAWPSPAPVTMSIFAGSDSFLELPVRAPQDDDNALPPFGPPETAPPLQLETLRPSTSRRTTSREVTSGVCEQIAETDDGHWRQAGTGLEYQSTGSARYFIDEADPLSARQRYERNFRIGRGDWQTRIEAWSELRADKQSFYLDCAVDAFEGDDPVFSRTWSIAVPRDMV